MSIWGVGIFESDDSVDFLRHLEIANEINGAIDFILHRAQQEKYLELPECARALSAAQIVVWCHTDFSQCDLPSADIRKLKGLAKDEFSHDILDACLQAVDAVQQGSEIRGLLQDAGLLEDWERELESLKASLHQGKAGSEA